MRHDELAWHVARDSLPSQSRLSAFGWLVVAIDALSRSISRKPTEEVCTDLSEELARLTVVEAVSTLSHAASNNHTREKATLSSEQPDTVPK